MNYKLNKKEDQAQSVPSSLKRLFPLLVHEKAKLILAGIAVLLSTLSNIIPPLIIAYTIDSIIKGGNMDGVWRNASWLLGWYVVGSTATFIQTRAMGGIARRLVFNLRNMIFNKLQELPVEFFNQNKAGDLISRINNDTDKLNQFMTQALMQFVGNFFLIVGTAVFILFLNVQLGLAVLLPAVFIFLVTRILSSWVKTKNKENLESTGNISSEIQENLSNFKVIVSFNRLDYFRQKFKISNERNYKAAFGAGIANNIFTPIYDLASNIASLIGLSFGLYLISRGNLTLGLLISFQFYVSNFYNPLRQMASVWSSFQLALASLERIWEVLSLHSNMQQVEAPSVAGSQNILEFQNVSFGYTPEQNILKNISFSLKKGKTYALVGPTGGGKTTTASLMARLYDPKSGTILLDGKDIRSYDALERTSKIGYILQDPFLFSGTLKENILYGNEKYLKISHDELKELLKNHGLYNLLEKFKEGLDTPIVTSSEGMSLGQKQIIAFMRAFLRDPELLILDEATANIDTITEQLLEEILQKLPKYTTKVIIAHRLNTIKAADEIFFVNEGVITLACSMEEAMNLLQNGTRKS